MSRRAVETEPRTVGAITTTTKPRKCPRIRQRHSWPSRGRLPPRRMLRLLPRLSAAILALGGAALVAGGQPACTNTNPEAIEKPCPDGQPCSVNLTILHTSDIHSRLFPYEQVIT